MIWTNSRAKLDHKACRLTVESKVLFTTELKINHIISVNIPLPVCYQYTCPIAGQSFYSTSCMYVQYIVIIPVSKF